MPRPPARRTPRRTMYDGDHDPPAVYVVDDPRDLADQDSQFANLDGLAIHYKHVASASSEARDTIVMIHGFSGNTSNFTVTPVWQELHERYHLMAFDRPGWGLSPRVVRRRDRSWPTESGDNPYTYEYSAELVERMLVHCHLMEEEEREGGRLVLLAHSHGGLLACYALSSRARLRAAFRGVVLVDAPILAWPVPRAAQSAAVRFPGLAKRLVHACAWMYAAGAKSPRLAGLTFGDIADYRQRYPNGMRGWDLTFRVRGWKASFAEWCAANAAAPPLHLERLQEVPILDVRGTRDRVISVRDGVECADATGAQTAFVAEAGHLPFAERPEEFMMVLDEFLNALDTGMQDSVLLYE